MRGTFRRAFALTVWTAAALALAATGCQTEEVARRDGPTMRRSSNGSEIVQVSAESRYAPSVVQAVAHSDMPSTLPTVAAEKETAPKPTPAPDTAPEAQVQGAPVPAGLVDRNLPRELRKVFLPSYIIEPPDTLILDSVRLIPRPPYRIEPLDVLIIQVGETLPGQPVAGPYPVAPEGTVLLGYSYGSVRIAGLTLEQAAAEIRRVLKAKLNDPQVAVALASFRGVQQVRGEHLVGPDGTITLGTYGCVNVTGLTLWQAKLVIEQHLSRFLLNPEISVSIGGYNSKVYYVIYDGAGFGQQIVRLPITGNETVLDGIANAGGLPPVASRRHIWLARPSPKCCYQILPVDWEVITRGGDPSTNWQLMPGDRVFVDSDPFIRTDNFLAKVFAPVERVLGITLLATTTAQSFRPNNNFNNNNGIR